MSYLCNDINNVGFPESQLIWRTSPENCAKISAAFHDGKLQELKVPPELQEVVSRLIQMQPQLDREI